MAEFRYSVIPWAEVSPWYRRMVILASEAIAGLLDMPVPEIHFIAKIPGDTLLGFAREPADVFVQVGLPLPLLVEVIAHECEHVFEYQWPEEVSEHRAYRFGREFARLLE